MAIENKEVRLRIIETLLPSITRIHMADMSGTLLKTASEIEEYITRENQIKQAVKPTTKQDVKPVTPAGKEKVVNYAGMK
ncbi:MAG: hypothetical protein V7745_07595 [Pseudomonadales bacterium]